jgi:hypothetical protein
MEAEAAQFEGEEIEQRKAFLRRQRLLERDVFEQSMRAIGRQRCTFQIHLDVVQILQQARFRTRPASARTAATR